MRLLDGSTFEDVSIARLREFEPAALQKSPRGYWLAFSGGKDSCVLLELAKRAGVAFEAVYNATTCDPPELVRFIRHEHPDVRIKKPLMNMWQLIRKKRMPPRRNARYCCEVLKEGGGAGRIVLTGIRAAESGRRSKRRMVEACYRDKTKRFVNPIIDWPTDAIWAYIRKEGLAYCSLYDEGWKRVGCVLCPMVRDTARHIQRWPHIAKAWERAIKATWKPTLDNRFVFESAEEYWRWWLNRDATALRMANDVEGQRLFFDDNPDEWPESIRVRELPG